MRTTAIINYGNNNKFTLIIVTNNNNAACWFPPARGRHTHDVKDLPSAARLFDLFVSSSPLMPMYAGAAAMMSARDAILLQARTPHAACPHTPCPTSHCLLPQSLKFNPEIKP